MLMIETFNLLASGVTADPILNKLKPWESFVFCFVFFLLFFSRPRIHYMAYFDHT